MNKTVQTLRSSLSKVFRRDPLWAGYIVTISTGFLLLSLLGIHGSSLNLLASDSSSILIGNDRPIRSDEFLRSTPFELNRIFHPTSSGVSQFSESSLNEPGNGYFELLRPERFLLSILLAGPQLFAALWWMPHLLLFLGVPLFLRSIKLQTKIAIPIAIIVAFSPSVVWWSNSIAGIVGRVALASGLIISSIDKKRPIKFLLGFSGMYLISGSFVDYAPWVIVVGIFFAGFGLLEFFSKDKKPMPTISGMLVGLLPLGLFITEKSHVFVTLAQTTYPGSRRFEGGTTNAFNWAFSAPQQWALLKPEAILASNQSELSLGFLIFLLPAFFTITKGIYAKSTSIKLLIFSQVYMFLLAWSFVPIPKFGLNPLELVSPERALTVTTTLAPIFFAIVLALTERDEVANRKTKADFGNEKNSVKLFIIATISFYITFASALTLRNSVSPFSIPFAGLTALTVAVGIALMSQGKKSLLRGVWIFASISFLLGVAVNPVVKGFANVYNMSVSQVLNSENSKMAWGSNSMFIDALLTLNGKSQISGQQLNGPRSEMWELIDPSKRYVDIWNAGASYVQLGFDQSNGVPIISRLGGDQILITINPCSEYAKKIDLGFIVSVIDLPNDCLVSMPIKNASYLGNTLRIYRIES